MISQIPQEFIDDLLTRIDIVHIIDSRVPLEKIGKNVRACCPFHSEKTASFTVSPEKQFYHCFGCSAHGTAISFLMKYDTMSFPEAIQELATHVGMTVPTSQLAHKTTNSNNLYGLLQRVSKYFVHQLHSHSQRGKFVNYLNQRGLSEQTIEKFNIGIAVKSWDNILKTFGHTKQETALLSDVGLLSHNDKGHIYDRFRNRIMFPIQDRRGRIIGFGGRVLDDSTPKYLNSPETKVFHKGQELYGLYQTRLANYRLTRIIIVEGYMDVITLADRGIINAVATLGTATTPAHLQHLLRSAPEVVFCFDGDNAGRAAAWRVAENALPVLGGNHEIKFMILPEGEDPESIVKKEGADSFNKRVENAQGYSNYFFSILQDGVDIRSMDGRARLVEIAKPYLRNIPAGVYRDMFEQRLAEISQTNLLMLNKHLERSKNKQQKAALRKSSDMVSLVRMAITILLQHPNLRQNIEKSTNIERLDQPGIDILVCLLETLHNNPHLNTAALLERWRGAQNNEYMQLLAKQPLSLSANSLQYELIGTVQKLREQALVERQSYLTNKTLNQLTDAEKKEVQSFNV